MSCRRATLLLWVAALTLCLTSCADKRPAAEPGAGQTEPTANTEPAEGQANESLQDDPGPPHSDDWPEMLPEERTVLSTGIVSYALDKAPPTLILGDVLIQPGETASLIVTLGRGFGSTAIKTYPGEEVVFTDARGDEVRRGRTDRDGRVVFEQTVTKPGNYFFRAAVNDKVDGATVRPALFCVYVRPADTPMVICDLDKTLVKSGFAEALIGIAQPFDHAADVVERLVDERKLTVVYLTHRHDFLEAASKQWLRQSGFPPGPLFDSSLGGLISGSEKFKTAELARIKKRFPKLELAVGDKPGDSNAYVANGVRSILLPDIEWDKDKPKYWREKLRDMETVSDEVTVCRDWFEIEEAIFDGKPFAPKRILDRVREMARMFGAE